MKLNYTITDVAAKEPTRAYVDAAAWDMYATTVDVVENNEFGYIEYGTGICIEIPTGYVGKLFPRSSVCNTGLILANCVGIIDPDYRGEIKFRFKWIPNTARYEVGNKIGQFRLEKTTKFTWSLVDALTETDRGDGGYGSSGK